MIRMFDGMHYLENNKILDMSASRAVKRAKGRRDSGRYIGRVPILRFVRYLSKSMKVHDTLNIEMTDLRVFW